jgi:ankyrin repeat protein
VLELLLRAGCDVNKTCSNGSTPLYAAAVSGRLHVIELLLQAGCDVNKTCWDGSTPLYVAAEQGHEAVCRRLLRVPGIEDRAAPASVVSPRPPSIGSCHQRRVVVWCGWRSPVLSLPGCCSLH